MEDWLEHPIRDRWHLHFTPTSSSWVNLIATWFSVLTRKALTNTSFGSTSDLQDRIHRRVEHWNHDREPFVWTRTAEEIIRRVARDQATRDRIIKSATTSSARYCQLARTRKGESHLARMTKGQTCAPSGLARQ